MVGAIASSRGTMSGRPMSPAWMMCSTPASRSSASERRRPWVSAALAGIELHVLQPGHRYSGAPCRLAAWLAPSAGLYDRLQFPPDCDPAEGILTAGGHGGEGEGNVALVARHDAHPRRPDPLPVQPPRRVQARTGRDGAFPPRPRLGRVALSRLPQRNPRRPAVGRVPAEQAPADATVAGEPLPFRPLRAPSAEARRRLDHFRPEHRPAAGDGRAQVQGRPRLHVRNPRR